MILKRFYDDKLAQASYLVGCPASGEAVVIDPNRDVRQYIGAAAKEGLRIVAVTETHIHADYVSGSRELAKRTGAKMYLSAEGGADWQYAFAQQDGAVLVRDGDKFKIGGIEFEVVKTPGHTPEHIGFIMTDLSASPEPQAVFTGDFVFVGDVGRPDLLERAAKIEGTMEAGARQLFRSLAAFRRRLPTHVMLWPAHGAGSACGKGLGGVPVTTLGYEEQANWAFKIGDEEEFVREVLAGQPEPPVYFAQMKRINRDGPPMIGDLSAPLPKLDPTEWGRYVASGATLTDTRSSETVLQARIPGTLHVPMGSGFTNWAGWFVPYDRPIVLIAEDQAAAQEAKRDLALIGLDDVQGWFGPEVVAHVETKHIDQMSFDQAMERFREGRATLLDVRSMSEHEEAHVPGAVHVPLGYLPQEAEKLPRDRPVAIHCQGGSRSPIAAALLQDMGFEVIEIPDGFCQYEAKGQPVGT